MSEAKKQYYKWVDKLVLHACEKERCNCLTHEYFAYSLVDDYVQELENYLELLEDHKKVFINEANELRLRCVDVENKNKEMLDFIENLIRDKTCNSTIKFQAKLLYKQVAGKKYDNV